MFFKNPNQKDLEKLHNGPVKAQVQPWQITQEDTIVKGKESHGQFQKK